MSEEKVVMFDSDEAAQFKSIQGWVSRRGQFFGDDEHTARYCGSTHTKCPTCGDIYITQSWCGRCRRDKDQKAFLELPVEKWDGVTPCCLYGTETYFFDESVLDFIADIPSDENVQICKCKPGYLSKVSDDNWCDDLPEDGELPDDVREAVNALNVAIEEAAPVCWYEDAIAIDVDDLRQRLNITTE